MGRRFALAAALGGAVALGVLLVLSCGDGSHAPEHPPARGRVSQAPAAPAGGGLAPAVEAAVASLRAGEPVPWVEDELEGNLDVAPALLLPYAQDPNPRVRKHMLKLIADVAERHPDPGVRRELVDVLAAALDDADKFVRHHAVKRLTRHPAADFSDASRSTIARHLSGEKFHRLLPLVAGSAGDPRSLDRLREIAGAERYPNAVRWNARAAGARLGDEAMLDELLAMYDGGTDTGARIRRGLQDLVFTGQPRALERVRGELFSDAVLPLPSLPQAGTGHAEYALHYLAQIEVEGFPTAPRHIGGYTGEDLGAARRWVEQPGNWERLVREASPERG